MTEKFSKSFLCLFTASNIPLAKSAEMPLSKTSKHADSFTISQNKLYEHVNLKEGHLNARWLVSRQNNQMS